MLVQTRILKPQLDQNAFLPLHESEWESQGPTEKDEGLGERRASQSSLFVSSAGPSQGVGL